MSGELPYRNIGYLKSHLSHFPCPACFVHDLQIKGNPLVKNETGMLTISTYDVANQLQPAVSSAGKTTFTFDAAGNQQIERAPSWITTNVLDYENQRTLVLLPSGQRETMTYNADLRMQGREV